MLFQPADPSTRPYAILAALLYFGLTLVIYTWDNDFSFMAHPDEPSKTRQVQNGKRNFNHPLLMLNAATVFSKMTGATDNRQEIVVVGRWLSAIYTSLSVALLSFLGWRLAGVMGAVGAGAVLTIDDRLFQYAHYFKEDPALLIGLVVFLVGAEFYSSRPGLGTSFLLGLGSALALSGKYLGALTIPMGLILIISIIWMPSAPRLPEQRQGFKSEPAGTKKSLINLAVFLGTIIIIAAAINYQLLKPEGWEGLTGGLEHEKSNLEKYQEINDLPNWNAAHRVIDVLIPAMWLSIIGIYFVDRKKNGRVHPGLWMTAAITLTFTLILTFSSRDSDRYYLPMSAFMGFLFGAGCSSVGDWLARGTNWKYLVFFFAVGLQIQQNVNRTYEQFLGFGDDNRKEVAEYVRENLPADAVIAYDAGVALPNPGIWRSKYSPQGANGPALPQKLTLVGTPYVGELASVEEMRADGVTHVIVAGNQYDAYLSRSAKRKSRDTWKQIQDFYDDLFEEKEGTLVWKWEKGEVGYVAQEICLFDIRENRPEPGADGATSVYEKDRE